MLVARRAAVLALLVASCKGCSSKGPPCSDVIRGNEPSIFHLSCGPTDLSGVALSGPCSVGDAGPSKYVFGAASDSLAFSSPNPGQCHVVLTFRTGFTYSADVTFTSQTTAQPAGCGANSYVGPTQQTYAVDNPRETCVDAGH